MWKDEIVEEIRQFRVAYAARFNYDIAAMVRDAQERQQQSGQEVITLPPKRPDPLPVVDEQRKAA